MVKVELQLDEEVEVFIKDAVLKGHFKGMFGDKPVVRPVGVDTLVIIGEPYTMKINA